MDGQTDSWLTGWRQYPLYQYGQGVIRMRTLVLLQLPYDIVSNDYNYISNGYT